MVELCPWRKRDRPHQCWCSCTQTRQLTLAERLTVRQQEGVSDTATRTMMPFLNQAPGASLRTRTRCGLGARWSNPRSANPGPSLAGCQGVTRHSQARNCRSRSVLGTAVITEPHIPRGALTPTLTVLTRNPRCRALPWTRTHVTVPRASKSYPRRVAP